MKKYVCLLLVSFMAFAVSSCSSDEEKEPAVGNIPLTPLFNEEDVLHFVHDGDEIVLQACRNVKMGSIGVNLNKVMEYSEDADAEEVRYICKEDPVPTELTFHWLNIKQEAPDKFVFTVKCETEDEPKEILFFFLPERNTEVFYSNKLLQFKLE